MEENMRASIAYTLTRSAPAAMIGAWVAVGAPASACANVIADWDGKAVVAVTPLASLAGTTPYMAQRMMGMVHAAMFDAVNSIEPRYRPYLVQLPADPATSKEAAAAAAAAAVLATIDSKTASEMKVALATYLASIPDGAAKSDGVKLGEAVAAKVLEARANDGCDAPDDYRPRTTPGVYVPTAITLASTWPNLKPFAMAKGSNFGQPRRFRWRARSGQPTTTSSKTLVDRPVRSERPSRPRLPGSGSSVRQWRITPSCAIS
jgi:hypothetical protein